MSKIFRVALLIFATTFGIGLYALIGAPVLRINYGSFANKVGAKVASVGASTLKSIPLPHLIPQKGPIYQEITSAANDFPVLKNLILSSDFGGQTTREIAFTIDKKVIEGEKLFSHFTGEDIPPSLGHLLLTQRYFVKHDDTFHGVLFISTVRSDATFAAMLQNETLLTPMMMNLAHPTMGISEVRMLSKIRFASRKIADIDARAITTSGDEPILIWGIKDGLLIIAGDKESFSAATKDDRP
jgi:hypothetical protein